MARQPGSPRRIVVDKRPGRTGDRDPVAAPYSADRADPQPPGGSPEQSATALGTAPSRLSLRYPARQRVGLLLAVATLSVALGALGVGAITRSAPERPPAAALPGTGISSGLDVAVGTVVMVIRHGEKPDDTNPLPGVNDNGQPDDSSLTQVGWDRARRLVDVFDPATGSIRSGLARPTVIFAARATDEGSGQRTRETVAPLAQKLGLQVNTNFGKGQEQALVGALRSQPGPILISWQHGEIPAIAQTLGTVTPAPPAEWPDERFDVIWTFTKTTDGWDFAQVPEMVLPGDTRDPITEQPEDHTDHDATEDHDDAHTDPQATADHQDGH